MLLSLFSTFGKMRVQRMMGNIAELETIPETAMNCGIYWAYQYLVGTQSPMAIAPVWWLYRQ